ncbi:GRB2-associated and regulator of MAPK protein 1 isoform X2 [Ambystoma mexicanum]|uniref:GRB2-associated and regulator of MAPK protein 1 isoform X2 n=1 Tax=Ambystoma mexicanum TaxID=8296 RepID=UPI0037E8BA7C
MEPTTAPPLKEVHWSTAPLPLDQLVSSYRLPQVVRLDSGFIMASNGQPATNRYVRFREMLVARLTYSFECGLSMCAIVFFISMFCLVLHWIIAFISTEMNEGGGGNNTTLAPGTKTIPTVGIKEGDFLIWDGSHFVWGYYTTPPTAVLSQWRTKNVDNDTMSQPGTYNNHTIPPAPISNNDLLFINEDGKVIMMTEHTSLYEELEKGGGREEGGPGSSPPITRRYRRREKSRRRRETGGKGYDEYYGLGLDKMEDPRHPHQANKWYADMSTTAKQTTNESCYVCSLIPHASGTPKVLLPRELPIVDAQCLLHLTLCRIKNTFQAHDVSFRMVQNNKTCYSQASGVICLKEPFFAIQGTLFSESKWKDEEVLCKAEALKGVQPEKLRWMERTCLPIWKEHIPKLTWVTAMEKPFKLQSEIQNKLCFKGEGKMAIGTNKNCNKTLTIPDMKKGTAALMDTYWVCGNKAYLHLPQSWSGSCSMATLHSTLMVIPESHIDRSNTMNEGLNQNAASPTTQAHLYVLSSGGKGEELSRNKRASNYISQASSDLLAQIPDKYRLFSSVETFFASLVSSVQARANAKWLQITRWELIQLANDTEEGFNIIKVELRALRLMTMQNRYVLDLLTAIDGGVCRKIGSACCTFVPSEDAENGSLSHVIEAVHNLGEKMKMEGGAEDSSWFDNIFSWVPSWLGVTMKFLIPIVVIILVMFCLCQVGLRCCANAVPNGAMMMVTMGNSGGTIKATQEVHVQTGTDNTPRYQLVPMCRDKYIVDKLWHTTIKEPRDVELEWYEEVWVDLEETGDCIYLTCTPDEYARRGESLRGVCRAWMPIKGSPAWDGAVLEEQECRRLEELKKFVTLSNERGEM